MNCLEWLGVAFLLYLCGTFVAVCVAIKWCRDEDDEIVNWHKYYSGE